MGEEQEVPERRPGRSTALASCLRDGGDGGDGDGRRVRAELGLVDKSEGAGRVEFLYVLFGGSGVNSR